MNCGPGAKAVLDAISAGADYGGGIQYPLVLGDILRVPPTEAVLPRALLEENVWSSGLRPALMSVVAQPPLARRAAWLSSPFRANEPNPSSLGQFLREVLQEADSEGTPGVRELHIARVIARQGEHGLTVVGVNAAELLERVSSLCGRKVPQMEFEKLQPTRSRI